MKAKGESVKADGKEPEEQKWCPAVGGTTRGYDPEWYNLDTRKWEKVWVSFRNDPKAPHGVPYPLPHGGLLMELGLFGEAQAWALAHWFAANREAAGSPPVQVRVLEYKVVYEIKAKLVQKGAER